jgi:hypothetical protein
MKYPVATPGAAEAPSLRSRQVDARPLRRLCEVSRRQHTPFGNRIHQHAAIRLYEREGFFSLH